MKNDYENILDDITLILKDVIWGKENRVEALFQYTTDAAVPPEVARLAEMIGTLVVQKEVHEYRLERLVEELFSTRSELMQARHDPLTGLPNRAMFEEMLKNACESAAEEHTRLALLLMDFDRFKSVNDRLGHAAGDDLLRQGVDRLQTALGERGVLGRLGGDEFVAILVGLDEAETLRIANAVCEAIRAPFALEAGPAQISVSVGIAFPLPDTPPARLMKNVDVAMYRAKSAGRNRVSVYQPSFVENERQR